MKRQNIEDEINKTLQSLDGIEQAKAPSFLLSQVNARIAKTRVESSFPAMLFVMRPALSFAALFCFALINIYMITQVMNEKVNRNTSSDVSIKKFANEYGIVSYSLYDKSK